MEILSQYERFRNSLPVKNVSLPESLYFTKADGGRVASHTVYMRFREILERCDIPHHGKSFGPRVHDLRHTFAVHSLVQLSRSGMDRSLVLPERSMSGI